MYTELNNLSKDGVLSKLLTAGLVSVKVLYYLDICNYVRAKEKAGISRTRAVLQAADDMRCSDRTIWRAIKTLQA